MTAVHDFDRDRFVEGDAWTMEFRRAADDGTGTLVGVDLTGLVPKAQIRNESTVITVNHRPWVASPTATGAYIPDQSLAGNRGRVILFVSSADNSLPPGYAHYDLQFTDTAGNVTTSVAGRLHVRRQVTT